MTPSQSTSASAGATVSVKWHRSMESIVTSPVLKSFLAGSISGTCSTLLFQPLDLLKTRIQTPSLAGIRSDGMFAICRNVLLKENLSGFWKGTSPSIARCVPGVGLYFCTLHIFQSKFGTSNPSNGELMALGASARCFVGVTMLPFTVVKVRYESGNFQYGGVMKAIRSIYTREGARGLYSGLGATLVRDAPYSGLYLMFYTNLKKLIPMEYFSQSQLPVLHFICGVVAGSLASVSTQPADVIKTHMQMNPQRFSTITSAVNHIYQTSGPRGFLAGILPRTLKRTLMTALAWTVYESVTRHLGLHK